MPHLKDLLQLKNCRKPAPKQLLMQELNQNVSGLLTLKVLTKENVSHHFKSGSHLMLCSTPPG